MMNGPGAAPGPACYGRGGARPAVTDANLALGYLPADRALAGAVRLCEEPAAEALGRLAAGVAHDVNNLMVSVIGLATHILRQLGEKHEQAENLADIDPPAPDGTVVHPISAPINAEGAAMQWATPNCRFRRYANPELK